MKWYYKRPVVITLSSRLSVDFDGPTLTKEPEILMEVDGMTFRFSLREAGDWGGVLKDEAEKLQREWLEDGVRPVELGRSPMDDLEDEIRKT